MNSTESSPYDRRAELVKFAVEEMKAQDVPDTEVPPLLADFSMWTALRLCGTPGGEAIIERMRHEVTMWSLGRHPMQERMRELGERVPSPEGLFDDPELDPTPLRIAMEHLLSHQRMPLHEAAAYFLIYSLGLVFHRLGYDRAKALVNTAKHELKRFVAESDENDD